MAVLTDLVLSVSLHIFVDCLQTSANVTTFCDFFIFFDREIKKFSAMRLAICEISAVKIGT